MDLKQELMKQAQRLMRDLRVTKALQNPKLMQGLMGAMQLRAKLQQNLEAGAQRVAKRLSLATEAELRELRRTVRKLEREVDAQKAAPHDRAS